ncbi:hypothetical protein NQ315_002117 [Exocentrus adspersus]|uniref:Uncharacterized protein n=1 Tax=Exocentrus adspersus TaxID=1586481 RepID=A0AAV8W0V6_9CUCU|nr:hypothetical protein NQ315_002117 [Exocentrus adspersus]
MLSYDMMPIVQDDLNSIGTRINVFTNISSNAYYGYQPAIHPEEKHAGTERMDNTYVVQNQHPCSNNSNLYREEAMQTESFQRRINRKRRWDQRDELVHLKKKMPPNPDGCDFSPLSPRPSSVFTTRSKTSLLANTNSQYA